MTTRTRREIVMSDMRVTGSYRYRDLFQIRPIYPYATVLEWPIGHHPLLLEYRYDVPDSSETTYNPELPQRMLSSEIDNDYSSKAKKWILLVLSVFSKGRVFQYPMVHEGQWFIEILHDSKDLEVSSSPLWGYSGYSYQGIDALIDDFSHEDNASIRHVDTNQYYHTETPRSYVIGQTATEFELPDRITCFLDAYISLPSKLRKAYLSSCSLFDQGIELFYRNPSLEFAACVSSLETLIAADYEGQPEESCKCCGQPKYKVRQKFLEFIKKYGNDSPKTNKIADKVYGRRSKILHRGQLFLGETEPRTIEAADEWLKDDHQRRDVIRFFRVCIINWLIGRHNEQSTPNNSMNPVMVR